MVESTNGEQGGQPEPVPESTGEARFTQDDLNRIIDERLKRAEAQKAKAVEDALKAERERQRIAGLEGEEKLKAEYEARLAEITKVQETRDAELAQARRELAVTKAEARLASLGLPVELASNLIGEDDKATEKNIQALQKSVNDLVTKKVAEGLNHGAPRAGSNVPSEEAEASDILDRAMGIRRS